MQTINDKSTVEIIDSVIKSLMLAAKVSHEDVANNSDIKYGLADIGVAIASTIEIINNRAIMPSQQEPFQMIEKNGAKIILDAYNANPSSMQAAIANFGKMHGGPKYVFLGGMKEMGAESKQEHLALINLLKSYTWEKVVLVGKEFSEVPAPFVHVEKVEDARPWLKKIPLEGARILIKGSRGISMEKLLEGF